MIRLCLAVLCAAALLFAATACGPSAQWVSVPIISCPGKDWTDLKKDASVQKMFGATACGQAGKSYAGDWRCESGVVEAKCQ